MNHLFFHFSLSLVKQDWFGQTCQDLWYVHWDNFSNHFGEADLGGEWLSLDKKVKCKLMELLHRLERKETHTMEATPFEYKLLVQVCSFNSATSNLTLGRKKNHEAHPVYAHPVTKRARGKKKEDKLTHPLGSLPWYLFWSYLILLECSNFLCAIKKKKMQHFQRFNWVYCQEMF